MICKLMQYNPDIRDPDIRDVSFGPKLEPVLPKQNRPNPDIRETQDIRETSGIRETPVPLTHLYPGYTVYC